MIRNWLASALGNARRRRTRPVRVYLDGCFDLMHYGHANALRQPRPAPQAKASGDELVVGLINDAEMIRFEKPPVMNEEERHTLVDAVKWVDEILTDVPYDLNPEFIQDLFTKHRIDYIIHGDDPCRLPDGSDAYAHARRLGRFREITHTQGVSAADIVERMLHCYDVNRFIKDGEPHPQGPGSPTCADTQTILSKFPQRKHLPTSRRLVQFSNGRVAPGGARIVYIDGAFDCFHPGHVKILKAAKAQGDFLLVGIHTDEEVQARRGPHLPIMNLHERSLSVLSCKYVDEVIIGAPCVMTDDLMTTFNISTVVRGSTSETSCLGPVEEERYAVPRAAGVYRELH
ncbi:hypothetical protein HYH03_016143 [Edaphochlamys debaryana]|uniref:ethanolamine-phosphate cytidylyltransferase n=1 Tax=Edaphochlamys debaryana TaxID=47281 RepID=A0A835XS56_9CHLO|nr:hypothetical protein HYH03_016143 [Edaphochlamys debaryana]|eukprot:KAG2485044.1 hypothetical protein HYH03_016143 [Edaphochlamys debaryana]